jgi:hypothetical protein
MKNILENVILNINRDIKPDEFDKIIGILKSDLSDIPVALSIIQRIDTESFYSKNKFSAQSTIDNMINAKEKTIILLKNLLNEYNKKVDSEIKYLTLVLQNFYMFMESLFITLPHRKSTLDPSMLKKITIQNEYDIQHILYALLKPLFTSTRTEVSQDTGNAATRVDILIPEINAVIETKCSRDNMSEKKLTEEIAADMIHYKSPYIYFFIYDKNKIIKNPQSFINTYNKKLDEKEIFVIIHQPKTL